MKLLVLLSFIDLCQWHVNLVLCLSSICDWDAEDHKQDGESTLKKHMNPSAQVRLRITSAISFSTMVSYERAGKPHTLR